MLKVLAVAIRNAQEEFPIEMPLLGSGCVVDSILSKKLEIHNGSILQDLCTGPVAGGAACATLPSAGAVILMSSVSFSTDSTGASCEVDRLFQLAL